MPSVESGGRRSPRLEGPPKLEGPIGGDGRIPVTGEPGRRATALIGDGRPGARHEVGELCGGLVCVEGPPVVIGDCWRSDGEGE